MGFKRSTRRNAMLNGFCLYALHQPNFLLQDNAVKVIHNKAQALARIPEQIKFFQCNQGSHIEQFEHRVLLRQMKINNPMCIVLLGIALNAIFTTSGLSLEAPASSLPEVHPATSTFKAWFKSRVDSSPHFYTENLVAGHSVQYLQSRILQTIKNCSRNFHVEQQSDIAPFRK